MQGNVMIAFFLTLLAGLATGIGSAMVLFTKRTNQKLLAFALGLSAGVMLYVSFVEILPESIVALTAFYPDKQATIYAVLSFFVGIGMIATIDYLIPEAGNPHEMRSIEEMTGGHHAQANKNLMRMGIFTAAAIAIHNFPEGISTFIAALEDPKMGIAITTAIAIHNIPEGIAVAIPIFYATGNRKKAFGLSFASGLSEPLGAVIGYLLMVQFTGNQVNGLVFAAVAGIMVYISLDELLPAAEKYGQHHMAIRGVIAGMAVMALSLILFI